MKNNSKQQLENIRRDAINELDAFTSLTLTVIDSNKYSSYNYINSYIVALCEQASGNTLRAVAEFYNDITNSDYYTSNAPILSNCMEIINTLTTFYHSLLTSHIEQLQNVIETNSPNLRAVLTSFLTATQALKDQLKQI